MKNQGKMLLTGCVLGTVVGVLLWAFLFIINECTLFIWDYIPSKLNFYYYPILVCAIGGILIGFIQKKFGEYPQELEEIMNDYNTNKTVRYDILHVIALAAFLPLVFGGSVGPEAGMTGLIVGLCCYVGDRIKAVFKKDVDFKEIGISATLAVIFGAPLFGLVSAADYENEPQILHKCKIIVNLASVLCALLSYMFLHRLVGGGLEISHFTNMSMEKTEWISLIPIALFGCMLGYIFLSIGEVTKTLLKPLNEYKMIRAIIGGLILGTTGVFISYIMFSGEAQMGKLQNNWQTISFVMLLLTGFVKLLLTEICFQSGWRGGKIFPLIFSSMCFGYAAATILPINPAFCIAIISSSLLAIVIRRPVIVAALLLLCFPLEAVLPILIAAIIGTIIPIPKILKKNPEIDSESKSIKYEKITQDG